MMTSCINQPTDVLCTLSLDRGVFQMVHDLKVEKKLKVEPCENNDNPKLWIEFYATEEKTIKVTIVKTSEISGQNFEEVGKFAPLPPETLKIESNYTQPCKDIECNTVSPLDVSEVPDEAQQGITNLSETDCKDGSLHYWSTDTELAESDTEESELDDESDDDYDSKVEKTKSAKQRKSNTETKSTDGKKPRKKYTITKMRGHYTCDRCPFETGFKKNLAQHMKENHKGEKGLKNRDRELSCEYCSVKLTDSYGLLRHVKRKHRNMAGYEDVVQRLDKARSFPCTYPGCTVTFARQSNVSRHILDVHMYDGPGAVCDICNKQVKNDKCLKVHKRIVHEIKQKDFLCFLCGTSYKSKGQLDDHIRNVHDTRRYPCDSCEFLGKSPKTLRRHVQRKHGPALYMCAFCAKKFRSKNNLDVHVMTIHQSGDIEQHQCPECPRKFNLKCNLKKHVDGVHKKIFLKCNYCNKRFMKAEFKEAHIRTKHPEMVVSEFPQLPEMTPLEAIELKPAGDYCLL